ncbi:GroES-like protein [Moniliophthora roreri MCA 2997]|uniref:GroES-like protein n=2 Tax=Moniliophthora roreri TaxID=221103 RepID=V2WN73_MONRO|nr:GroES-like protein [Moniliophthora roreri MCA 2997]
MIEQKALLLEKQCGALVLGTRPIPKPGSGELLVKVQAVGLNPVDWKIQRNGFVVKKEDYPTVLGTDIAGDVETLGEGVDAEKWSKGTRVFFQGKYTADTAGFQQYTLIPADLAAKIPPKLAYSEAASIPVAFVAAAYGLFAPKPLGGALNPEFDNSVKFTGKSSLVIGGNTSVGQYSELFANSSNGVETSTFTAIQLLSKVLGFSQVIAYASKSSEDYLKSLGATRIIDRHQTTLQDLPSVIREITTDRPLKVVYDAFGSSEGHDIGFSLLVDDGLFCTVDPSRTDITENGKRAFGVFGIVHLPTHRDYGVKLIEQLERLAEEDVIVPNRVLDLPNGLAGIVEGLETVKNDKTGGYKLVAHPQD